MKQNIKKLQLQDLFIGAWVVEENAFGRQSIPMYVSCLFEDGDIYLDFNGNEADPWEAKIEDIRGIRISSESMQHFQFKEIDHNVFEKSCEGFKVVVSIIDHQQYRLVKATIRHDEGGFQINENIIYIHQLQKFVFESTRKPLVLEYE